MKKSGRRAADFAAGGITAISLFAALTLMAGIFFGSPDTRCGEGLAVISAKLNSLGMSAKSVQEAEPEQETVVPPLAVNPKLAGELIRLSGFGGCDIEAAPQETEESEPKESSDEEPREDGLPYPEKQEEKSGEIVRRTYFYRPSTTYLELPEGGLLRNCTDIDPEYLLEQCSREPDFEVDLSAGPLVLIMHTHTTESYEPYQRDYYDASFSSRTTDLEKSVAAVGTEIAAQLEAAGIGVIHDETVHDYPRYTGAYDRSAKTVAEYLKAYPSIKIVIDVHRDAIEEDSVRYAPAVEINGQSAAQVMIICGCTNVPQYRYNLRIASRLQSQMESDWAGLTRPILFDERNYNQEMTHGSFLIEMGSNANSLDEALYSGSLVGQSLAKVIKEMAR